MRSEKRHVLLVGLPGSGKSTVGPLIAEELGTRFVDVDRDIEQRTGKRIAELFAADGEAGFRRVEREAVARLLDGPPCVIAAGGGWAAQPGNLESVGKRALTVYLRVPAEVAAGRATVTPDARPLLGSGGDVGGRGRMIELLRVREAFYQRSEAAVDAQAADPRAVVQEVVNLARSLGGWY